MKCKIVLITENNIPAEKLGPDPAEKIKKAWGVLCGLATLNGENEDRAKVVSVEMLEG